MILLINLLLKPVMRRAGFC